LSREVGTRGITVNAVAPGFINTAMTQALNESQQQAILSQIPLGRMGEADDIANAVVFLASEEASYITGTVLHVNGGMY
jgi:Dehydrogenases with different specificities (related to short-chain alcohol dehydrogenases)